MLSQSERSAEAVIMRIIIVCLKAEGQDGGESERTRTKKLQATMIRLMHREQATAGRVA
jgi:hypothetical protein